MTLTPAQKAAATRRRRAAATGYRPGDKVLTNTPRSPRYHNRPGTVTEINQGEVGVTFNGVPRAAAWFLPAELCRPQRAQVPAPAANSPTPVSQLPPRPQHTMAARR